MISHSAARPDGTPRRDGVSPCTRLPRDFPPQLRHAPHRPCGARLCLWGRDTQSCLRDPKQFGHLLPLPLLAKPFQRLDVPTPPFAHLEKQDD